MTKLGSRKLHIGPKVTKMGSIIGLGIDYNAIMGLGLRETSGTYPANLTQVAPPPPPPVFSYKRRRTGDVTVGKAAKTKKKRSIFTPIPRSILDSKRRIYFMIKDIGKLPNGFD